MDRLVQIPRQDIHITCEGEAAQVGYFEVHSRGRCKPLQCIWRSIDYQHLEGLHTTRLGVNGCGQGTGLGLEVDSAEDVGVQSMKQQEKLVR